MSEIYQLFAELDRLDRWVATVTRATGLCLLLALMAFVL